MLINSVIVLITLAIARSELVVHINDTHKGSIVALKLANIKRAPVVKPLHNISPFLFSLLKHKLKSPVVVQKIPTTLAPPDCICVPYYQCDANNTIINDGIGLIDIRTNSRVRRCTGDLEVCCKPSKPRPPTETTTTKSGELPTNPLTSMIPPGTMQMSSSTVSVSPSRAPVVTSGTDTPLTSFMTPATIATPVTQPITSQTPVTQPVTSQPPVTQPITSQTPVTQPITSQPPVTQPITSQTPVTQPITSQTPVTQSITTPSLTPITVTGTSTLPIDCTCVPIYLCDDEGYIVTNGEGIINPRLTSLPCGAGEVCCQIRNSTINFPTTLPIGNSPVTVSSTLPFVSQVTVRSTSIASPSSMVSPSSMASLSMVSLSMAPMASSSLSPLLCADYCVSPPQCDANGFIIVSGAGNISPRDNPEVRQSLVVSSSPPKVPIICTDEEICCKLPANGNTVTDVIFPDYNAHLEIDPRANFTTEIKNPGTTRACHCIKSSMCPVGNEVEPDATGIIDPRFRLCVDKEDVCCRLIPITTTAMPHTMAINRDSIITGPDINYETCGVPAPPCKPEECPTVPGESYFGEFPWMVALLRRQEDGKYMFICGGSILNSKAILTAAHCVLQRTKGVIVARVGEYNTDKIDEAYPFQESEVQAIVTHPQYYSGGLYNDIAVLILDTPISFTFNVRPICLPDKNMVFAAGTNCLASGWGKDSFDGGSYQKILQKITLPLVDRDDCQEQLRLTKLSKYFQLHSSFLCAGGEQNRDTCTGDGGGPLVCNVTNGAYVQVGIVSWGIGCGEWKVPAVYVDVAKYRSWIDQQLANYGIL